MGDLDLSHALDGPRESDERGCDLMDVQDEVINLDAGLDLRISCRPGAMKAVATLVVALKCMENLALKSDAEHCRAIVDSVIETTLVQRVGNCKKGRGLVFKRLRSWECRLTDNEKKDIVCKGKDLKLLALTLTAANSSHRVTFKMATYGSPGIGQTVVLSVINHNLYISCTMNGDRAELKLEECRAEDVKMICSDGTKDRFLFYMKETEFNVKTFESVMCRGWFISTSYSREEEPLEMCRVDSSARVCSFRIN